MSDPELSIRVPHLLDLVLASSAPSTTTRYSYGWTRWRCCAQSKQGVSFMPARPLCIAMYLLELTGDALQKNTGRSAIDSALYGKKESYLSQFNPSNPWISRLWSKSLSIITQL